MGRGSSKAGGGGGGLQPQVVNPPSQEDVRKGNILPKGGVPYSDFENMTDDEKADVVDKAMNTGVPIFLEDSPLQRFAYFTGMDTKPTLVSDSQLDNVQGEEIFRTVNNAYNRSTDIGYSSTDIAKQITEGDFTMYSDSGGSAHGKAIYFANNFGDSAVYAGSASQQPQMIRAKITGNTMSEGALGRMYQNAVARGDKLALSCKKASPHSSDDARNLYGLVKGVDVMTADYGSYRMVLNRRGITASSTFKSTVGRSRW